VSEGEIEELIFWRRLRERHWWERRRRNYQQKHYQVRTLCFLKLVAGQVWRCEDTYMIECFQLALDKESNLCHMLWLVVHSIFWRCEPGSNRKEWLMIFHFFAGQRWDGIGSEWGGIYYSSSFLVWWDVAYSIRRSLAGNFPNLHEKNHWSMTAMTKRMTTRPIRWERDGERLGKQCSQVCSYR